MEFGIRLVSRDLLLYSCRVPAFFILRTEDEASLDLHKSTESGILDVGALFYENNVNLFVLLRLLSWNESLPQYCLRQIRKMDYKQLNEHIFRNCNHMFNYASSS